MAISSNCIETATVRGFLRANVGTGHSTLHAARGTRIWHFVVKERGSPCLYLNYSADTRRGAEVEESVHRSILRMCASLSEAPYPQACDTAPAAVRGRMNNTCLYLEDSAREALALEESWAAIDLAILAAAFERLTRQGIAKNPGPPEPTRAGKTWKREEETRLEVACTPSATYQSLADELGRTPLAIQVKLHQMGLRESPPSTLAAIKDHPFRRKHAVAPTATSEPAEPQGTNRGTREVLERAKRTLSPAPQNTPRAIGALEGVPMPRATVGSPRFQSSPPEKRRGHGAVSTPPRVDDPMQVGKRASTAHPGGGATPDAPPKKAGKAKKDVPTPVALNRVLTMGTRTPLKKPVKMPATPAAVEPSVNIADLVAERTELMGQRTLVGSKEHARLIVITQILAAVVRQECTGHDPAQADATVDFRDLAAPAAPLTHAEVPLVSPPVTRQEGASEGRIASAPNAREAVGQPLRPVRAKGEPLCPGCSTRLTGGWCPSPIGDTCPTAAKPVLAPKPVAKSTVKAVTARQPPGPKRKPKANSQAQQPKEVEHFRQCFICDEKIGLYDKHNSKLKGWWTHLQGHWNHKEAKTKEPAAVEALLSFGYLLCKHCNQLVPKGNIKKHQRKESCRFEQRNAADPDDPEGIRKSSRDLVGPLRGKLPPLIVVATFQVVTVKTIPESLRIPLGEVVRQLLTAGLEAETTAPCVGAVDEWVLMYRIPLCASTNKR